MDQRNKPPASQDKNNLCAFCKNIAKTQCAGCLKVYYCSKEHQKLDWKNHANNCNVLKLVKEPSGQQYYVATRNIKVGEVVYNEREPIVMGPSVYAHGLPSCLSCYVGLTEKTARPCKTCGWPLCCDCQTHGPECVFAAKFLKKKISITDFERPDESYRQVMTMRSLALRTTNPSAYNKIVKLRARTTNEVMYNAICDLVKTIRRIQTLCISNEQDSSIDIEICENLPVLIVNESKIIQNKN